MKKQLLYVLLIFLFSSVVFCADINDVNQHTTQMSMQVVKQVNEHTDTKMDEMTAEGDRLINEAETKIKSIVTKSLLTFIFMTIGLSIVSVSIQLVINDYFWKKRIKINDLHLLDEKMREGRGFIKDALSKNYGKRKIIKELILQGYNKKDAKKCFTEVI